jgi:hypothetical protein
MSPAIHARAFSWLDSFNVAAAIAVNVRIMARSSIGRPTGLGRHAPDDTRNQRRHGSSAESLSRCCNGKTTITGADVRVVNWSFRPDDVQELALSLVSYMLVRGRHRMT